MENDAETRNFEEEQAEYEEEQAGDLVINYETLSGSTVSSQKDFNQHNIDNDDKILKMLVWRQTSEMNLRKDLTNRLVAIMTLQIIAINTFLFFLGFGKITLQNLEPLRWLFTFVIAEVIGFVSVIVNYLFSSKTNQALDLVKQYIDSYHPVARMNDQSDTNYNF